MPQIHFSFSIIRILTKSPFVKSQNQLNLYFIQMLFLLINPSHPLPPERKNAIAPGIRLLHQKPFFYFIGINLPSRPDPPAIGPHFDHFAQLCPFGPSFGLLGSPILHLRASSAAPFCLSGHPRASLGILGPGHILQGNFPFYCNQLSISQKEILAPGTKHLSLNHFCFSIINHAEESQKVRF